MKVTRRRRSKDAYMDRFGGGWRWKVGIQASRGFRTIIVSFLVTEFRITRDQ